MVLSYDVCNHNLEPPLIIRLKSITQFIDKSSTEPIRICYTFSTRLTWKFSKSLVIDNKID